MDDDPGDHFLGVGRSIWMEDDDGTCQGDDDDPSESNYDGLFELGEL